MSLVVYAEASAGSYPGHMVIGQEPAGRGARYFGFRFDPADLPDECRPQDQWRKFLLPHAVPGKIVHETAYVAHLLQADARTYYEKRANCDTPIASRLPPRNEWQPHAWYSFRPDDSRPGQEPCYNCVKWAIIVANSLVAGFLVPVDQGRLKRTLAQLQKRP